MGESKSSWKDTICSSSSQAEQMLKQSADVSKYYRSKAQHCVQSLMAENVKLREYLSLLISNFQMLQNYYSLTRVSQENSFFKRVFQKGQDDEKRVHEAGQSLEELQEENQQFKAEIDRLSVELQHAKCNEEKRQADLTEEKKREHLTIEREEIAAFEESDKDLIRQAKEIHKLLGELKRQVFELDDGLAETEHLRDTQEIEQAFNRYSKSKNAVVCLLTRLYALDRGLVRCKERLVEVIAAKSQGMVTAQVFKRRLPEELIIENVRREFSLILKHEIDMRTLRNNLLSFLSKDLTVAKTLVV